ncbi:Permease of the drug/metabolite transporter (DMT) superfamily [Paenibacillus uliginis N3/975]|uniref:Permease of the drug/metabolite transporter (DMT) superfamily n=1 Tax=Paenibacillus uliginis N3/975 TaxID=1313296 RepID=A0A1X7GGS3_9BACL|nr:DMT family transporter [Paenibacillus uliginis]SMF69551.1 Permease of the drug/metabolite transporter (DMT) superfamily [Paenibacillus uliginis N3/975]
MAENNKAYIAAIVYAFIIGLSFMFVKVTLTVASPMDTLAHRFTIALIGATIFIGISKNKLRIDWRVLLRIFPLALLYPIAFFALQVFGLVRTSSSEAGIIQATVPIFTLVFARIILKEKATRGQLVFISLSVMGVIYLLFMNGVGAQITNLIGSGLILLSAVAAALYNVFARKLTQQYSLMTLTYSMTLFGFLVFNTMAIGNHVMKGTTKQFFQPFMHIDFVLAILFLGVLSSLVTSYLSNYVLSKIEATKMSVFSNFATLITILAGVIFLKEEFYLYHLAGAVVIIIGVVGTNYFGRGSKHREKV